MSDLCMDSAVATPAILAPSVRESWLKIREWRLKVSTADLPPRYRLGLMIALQFLLGFALPWATSHLSSHPAVSANSYVCKRP